MNNVIQITREKRDQKLLENFVHVYFWYVDLKILIKVLVKNAYFKSRLIQFSQNGELFQNPKGARRKSKILCVVCSSSSDRSNLSSEKLLLLFLTFQLNIETTSCLVIFTQQQKRKYKRKMFYHRSYHREKKEKNKK